LLVFCVFGGGQRRLGLFTGIIEELGLIRELRSRSQGARLSIGAKAIAPTLKVGDSIAVNGVCLTVTSSSADGFWCDLSSETLSKSSFGAARERSIVNLERSMAADGRFGGHFVQGHVDGVGKLLRSISIGDGQELSFSYPAGLQPYLVYKGSVAVDGVSLTIAALDQSSFSIAVIPHTLKTTSFGRMEVGTPVNLEGDILAKYFERFFQLGIGRRELPSSELTLDYLKEQGF
jgi:riboflavin synthase